MFNLNLFNKKFKKILLSINRAIESFFNNLTSIKKRYTNNKKKLEYVNNRIALVVGSIIILFFSYLLLPLVFNKNETKALLKDQILKEYGINIKFTDKIEYGLFPRPYFYSKGLVITNNNKDLSNSNHTKIYISLKNLFSVQNLKVTNLIFKQNEFKINSKDIDFFNKIINSVIKDDKIIFKDSNLFYEDKNNEILFFSKIKELDFYYDKKKLSQIVSLNYEIFNVPFKLNIINLSKEKTRIIKLTSKKIRLDIKTILKKDNLDFNGLVDILVLNKNRSFNLNIKDNLVKFNSDDEKFKGLINIKPFYFSSELNFNQLNEKKLFKSDSILMNILDSEILNNPNFNANLIIKFNKIDTNPYLNSLIFKFFFEEGDILIDNSSVKWNDSVLIDLNNIQLINNKESKRLVGEVSFNFNDIDKLYSYYQIKRNYRKRIQNISFDFVLDITENKFVITNLKINNNSNERINIFLENFNFKNDNLLNKVKFRNFVKEFFKIYAG